MSSGLIIALELALVLGVVIGLAVWELWRLRRDRSRPPE
jgi:dolichyl-phosphate-mannose--protein O-mannosyl transferase